MILKIQFFKLMRNTSPVVFYEYLKKIMHYAFEMKNITYYQRITTTFWTFYYFRIAGRVKRNRDLPVCFWSQLHAPQEGGLGLHLPELHSRLQRRGVHRHPKRHFDSVFVQRTFTRRLWISGRKMFWFLIIQAKILFKTDFSIYNSKRIWILSRILEWIQTKL